MKSLVLATALLLAQSATQAQADFDGIKIEEGYSVYLTGVIDPQAVNARLGAQGMEVVLTNGVAVANLVVNSYPRTSVGPYQEFLVSVPVARRGEAPSAERGSYYFTLDRIDSETVADLGRTIWGTAYRMGTIGGAISHRITKAGDTVGAVTTVSDKGGRSVLRLSMGAKQAPIARIDFPIYGHSAFELGLQRRYKVDVGGPAFMRKFDPAIDTWQAPEGTELKNFLRDVKFQPFQWTVISPLTGFVSVPETGPTP